ncbi:hypothetical protein EHT25_00340 [Larkinella rosea]|uniref:Uncharacterized protein n=1 Tax=Larkinella rosea TaxID=2025312 RepID=A0A3P1BZE1_9BACT|nr:hypothetical protein EHT25_00340 [Larkinella rosea]
MIDDPQLYLLLSEYERIINHLQVMPFIHEQDPPERRRLRKENAALILEGQERLRQAKAFYHIKI